MDIRIINVFSNNRSAIANFERGLYCLKIQKNSSAFEHSIKGMDSLIKSADIMFSLKDYFNNCALFDEKYFNKILACQLKAQETKNYILLIGNYEKKLLPLLYKIQEFIMSKEKNLLEESRVELDITKLENKDNLLYNMLKKSWNDIPNQYYAEFAADGTSTIRVELNHRSIYLHSNISPLLEAFVLVNDWYDTDKNKYIIYGLGMGYHAGRLALIDNKISVEVYENNFDIIKVNTKYSDYNVFTDYGNLCLYYDPDLSKLQYCLEKKSEDTKFVVYYPSLHYIKDKEYCNKLYKIIDKYGTD